MPTVVEIFLEKHHGCYDRMVIKLQLVDHEFPPQSQIDYP